MTTSTFQAPSESKLSLDKSMFPNSGKIYELLTKRISDHKKETKQPLDTSLNFFVLGCGENETERKKIIARLMNDIALKKRKRPDFIILLGDNFEANGLNSDASFKKGFTDVYNVKELEEIYGIPFFVVPGNHDHGFPVHYDKSNYFKATTGVNNDLKKINDQVRQTYKDEQGNEDPEKVKRFSRDTLHLSEMRKKGQVWNMPGRYYGLHYGDTSELFFIDANTYVKEYIEYYLKGNCNENGQPDWLDKNSKKNPDKLKLYFLHHSLHTCGKRSLTDCSDLSEYLDSDDLKLLRENGIIKENEVDATGKYKISFNELIKRIFDIQEIYPGFLFAAHDHAMYHYDNKAELKKLNGSRKAKFLQQFTQVVSGGAGGDSQNRFLFDESTQNFIKHPGVVDVEIGTGPNPDIIFDYYAEIDPKLYKSKEETLRKFNLQNYRHHLRYSNRITGPLKNDPDKTGVKELKKEPDETGVKELKELFLNAREAFLKKIPNTLLSDFTNPKNFQLKGNKKMDGWVPTSEGWKDLVDDTVPLDFFLLDDIKNFFDGFESISLKSCINYLQFIFSLSPEAPGLVKSIGKGIFNTLFSKKDSQELPSLIQIFSEKLEAKYGITRGQLISSDIAQLKEIICPRMTRSHSVQFLPGAKLGKRHSNSRPSTPKGSVQMQNLPSNPIAIPAKKEVKETKKESKQEAGSLKEFTPAETHEYYDSNGDLIPATSTTGAGYQDSIAKALASEGRSFRA